MESLSDIETQIYFFADTSRRLLVKKEDVSSWYCIGGYSDFLLLSVLHDSFRR